ncbi:MAG: hypothetical protein WA821_20975 [Anaerolineales bacterium]
MSDSAAAGRRRHSDRRRTRRPYGCAWPDHAYCCDYFFVSEDLGSRVRRLVVNRETAASDHQPILLEIGRE